VDSVLLVAAWFRKNSPERKKLMTGGQAACAVAVKRDQSKACRSKKDAATDRR